MKKDALLNILLAAALVLLSIQLLRARSTPPSATEVCPSFATTETPAPSAEVPPSAAPSSPEERADSMSAADFALAALGAAQTPADEAPAAPRPLTEWEQIDPKTAILDPAAARIRDTMVLSAGHADAFNAMTIGWWGTGILWRRPVLSVYVSSSRYTFEFMESNEFFTVCSFPDDFREGVMYLGRHSGRDGDKIGPSGLTAAFTPSGNPYFQEADAVFECRLLYKTVLGDHEQLPDDARQMYLAGTGPHTLYVGEIVHVWRR